MKKATKIGLTDLEDMWQHISKCNYGLLFMGSPILIKRKEVIAGAK